MEGNPANTDEPCHQLLACDKFMLSHFFQSTNRAIEPFPLQDAGTRYAAIDIVLVTRQPFNAEKRNKRQDICNDQQPADPWNGKKVAHGAVPAGHHP
jgi:hypothetical protein